MDMTPQAVTEKMAEKNRNRWADVGNAIGVLRGLTDMLDQAQGNPDERPDWLTPVALGSVFSCVEAMADEAHTESAALEDRLARPLSEGAGT